MQFCGRRGQLGWCAGAAADLPAGLIIAGGLRLSWAWLEGSLLVADRAASRRGDRW